MTVKLPEPLARQVEAEARIKQTAKSAIIRNCLEEKPAGSRRRKGVTCLDLMGDLFGSQPGPRDASTNKSYLKGFGRERTGAR
jgi:hypothetical protein